MAQEQLELICGALAPAETAPVASLSPCFPWSWGRLLSSWTVCCPGLVLLDVSSQLLPSPPLCPPGPLPCALGIPDDPLPFGGGNVSERSKLVIAGVRSIRVPVCGLHGEEVERPGTESESPELQQHA